jgi:DNA-binding CsgD family transcriptional regulator
MTNASMPQADPPAGWLFLSPDAVPARWRDRSVPVAMVPLLPGEARALLGGAPSVPELEPEDEPLARLLAAGKSLRTIAVELGIPLRRVERRIGRLRVQFGAKSKNELASLLARRGF